MKTNPDRLNIIAVGRIVDGFRNPCHFCGNVYLPNKEALYRVFIKNDDAQDSICICGNCLARSQHRYILDFYHAQGSATTGHPPNEGLKSDSGKLRYDLIPAEQLEQIADILTSGAEKYAPNSWQRIDDAENRYYAALMRHIQAWRMGEAIDPESGRPHLAHVMVNAIFLANLTQKS